MAGPFEEDFLQKIVSIHFPSGGYFVLDIAGFNDIPGSVPICPAVSVQLDKAMTLITQEETCAKVIFPAQTIVNTLNFIWSDCAPLPTASNYSNIVATQPDEFGPVQYAQQWSRFFHPNGTGGGPPWGPSIPNADGYYPSFAAANTRAAQWNGVNPGPFPSGVFYLPSDGTTEVGPVGFQPVHAAQLTFTSTVPAHSTARLRRRLLIKVPSDLTRMTCSVAVSGTAATSDVAVLGYHGPAPRNVGQIIAQPDSSASASRNGPGTATYTVTSKITNQINRVTAVRS